MKNWMPYPTLKTDNNPTETCTFERIFNDLWPKF
jgi:hypothetical protein